MQRASARERAQSARGGAEVSTGVGGTHLRRSVSVHKKIRVLAVCCSQRYCSKVRAEGLQRAQVPALRQKFCAETNSTHTLFPFRVALFCPGLSLKLSLNLAASSLRRRCSEASGACILAPIAVPCPRTPPTPQHQVGLQAPSVLCCAHKNLKHFLVITQLPPSGNLSCCAAGNWNARRRGAVVLRDVTCVHPLPLTPPLLVLPNAEHSEMAPTLSLSLPESLLLHLLLARQCTAQSQAA